MQSIVTPCNKRVCAFKLEMPVMLARTDVAAVSEHQQQLQMLQQQEQISPKDREGATLTLRDFPSVAFRLQARAFTSSSRTQARGTYRACRWGQRGERCNGVRGGGGSQRGTSVGRDQRQSELDGNKPDHNREYSGRDCAC